MFSWVKFYCVDIQEYVGKYVNVMSPVTSKV